MMVGNIYIMYSMVKTGIVAKVRENSLTEITGATYNYYHQLSLAIHLTTLNRPTDCQAYDDSLIGPPPGPLTRISSSGIIPANRFPLI